MTAFPAFPEFRERRGGGPVRAAAVLLAVVLFAAGCSFKLPGAGIPSRMYVLTPKSTFPPDLPTVDWQL